MYVPWLDSIAVAGRGDKFPTQWRQPVQSTVSSETWQHVTFTQCGEGMLGAVKVRIPGALLEPL